MNSNQVTVNQGHILVVDAHPDELNFLSDLFIGQGYEVQQVVSGQILLSLLEIIIPDLILIDASLPETDGYEICRRLKAREKTNKTPVIFLLEAENLNYKSKVFEVGGTDYIIKPFDAPELLSKVAKELKIINLEKSLKTLNTIIDYVPYIAENITESQQREERLRLLERAIGASSNGIVITDATQPDNPIIYVNLGFEKMTGYTAEEVIGKNGRFLQGKETEETSIREIRTAIKEERECLVTLYNYRKDGTFFWNELSISPVRDAAGKLTHFIGVKTDITQSKQAKEELKATKERFELVIRAANDGFWDWDFLTGKIYFSTRWKEMIGYSDSELSNKLSSWEQVIFIEDKIAALKMLDDYNSGIIPQFLATQRFHHKDGSTVYILSRAIHLKDENGKVIRMVGAHTDVTELVKSSAALANSESLLNGVLNSSLDGVMAFSSVRDEAGKIIDFKWLLVNQSAAKIFERDAEDLIGKLLLEEMPGNREIGLFEKYIQVVETGEPQEMEFYYYHEGIEAWFQNVAVKLEDGFAVTFRDISTRKQAENALEKQIGWASLLRQITQEIRSSLDTQKIFQTAVTQIGKTFGVTRCLLHTYINIPTPQIITVAEYIESGYISILHKNIPIEGNPHMEQVLSTDQAIASDNVYSDPLLAASAPICHQINLLSMLAVRTSYQELANGAICLHQCDRFRHWTEDEIELLEAVAAQVGIALAQANLLEQEKKQRWELDNQNLQLQAEIRERQRMNSLLDGQNHILELIAKGLPLHEILEVLARFIEFQSREAFCVFLLADASTNRLYIGASPSLPDSYNQAIDGIEIAPNNGSCGTAAYRKTAVITEDIATDPLWINYKDIALKHGLRACWSTPICSSEGDVLATFVMYYRQPRSPSAKDQDLIAKAVYLARIALERYRSEQNYRTIFDASYDGIAIHDQETGTLLDVNQKFCEMFGIKREVILHLGIEDLSAGESPYSQKEVKNFMQKAATEEVQKFEWRSKHASGRLFWTEVILKPIVLGSKQRLLEVVRDISDRKSTEEALRQAAYAAEAASRTKSQFLANMSHELRTPLNAILGFTQLMNRHSSINAQQQEYLEIINRSGEHLLSLINDILSMSKIEAGQVNLNENSFDLYRLLSDLEEMFRLKAKSKNLQLNFDIKSNLPRYIKTDESKLRQVLINLLSNAIKFTQKGAIILRSHVIPVDSDCIDEQHTQKRIYFEVEDRGVGISPAEMDKLFSAFVQTESGRNSQEGTGLGLPISREFIKLMGGEISVKSTLGEGSVFSFHILISLAQINEVECPQSKKKVIGLEPNQQEYRILIVEDKAENRKLLRDLLSPLGFQLQEAVDGEKALAIWSTWQPQLILMDLRMPVMDGYETTKRIKATPQGENTIIIALTASAFSEDRSLSLNAGCDDFVGKPFREDVLFEKLAKYLGLRYIYADSKPLTLQKKPSEVSKNTPDINDFTLDQEALQVMSDKWIKQLHQATLSADEEQIFQLLGEIPESHANLSHTLADLVNNFQLENIINLIEQIAE